MVRLAICVGGLAHGTVHNLPEAICLNLPVIQDGATVSAYYSVERVMWSDGPGMPFHHSWVLLHNSMSKEDPIPDDIIKWYKEHAQ